ncbi:hypothetical protein OAB70_00595 [bacterium]|nr:hypothetical protein [bacterium]
MGRFTALSIILAFLMTFSISVSAEDDNLFKGGKSYGSFKFFKEVPNALFFEEAITNNDSFEFRKAIRNHNIDTIVLSSPGGALFEGLTIAGMIFDKELTTYVPKTGRCASACAFMFFAGNNRQATGRLGVHQFYSTSDDETAKIANVEYGSQFTVSEIIGYLNEFETPPFVFEKMFAQKQMYFFSEDELVKLNTAPTDEATLANFSKIDEFVVKAKEATEQADAKAAEVIEKIVVSVPKLEIKAPSSPDQMPDTELELSTAKIKTEIQKELNRLGCEAGTVDGIIGQNSQLALFRFTKKTDYKFNLALFSSTDFLIALRKINSFQCPEVTPVKLGSFYKIDWECSGEGNGDSSFFKVERKNARSYNIIGTDRFGNQLQNAEKQPASASLSVDFESYLTLKNKPAGVILATGKYSETEKKIYLNASSNSKYNTCKMIGSLASPQEYTLRDQYEDVRPKTLTEKAICWGHWGIMLGMGMGATCIPW